MSTSEPALQRQVNIVEDENALTDYEAALYDRGIRVWGVDAQNRLRRARVLFVGVSGLSAEIAKNVALAGAGSITVIDNTIITENDIGLFINGDQSVGKTRSEAAILALQELNPLIKVNSESMSPDTLDAEFIKGFTVVCVDSLDSAVQLRINNLCRMDGVSFILTHCFGQQGYFFSDLGNTFKYAIKKKTKVAKSGDSNGHGTNSQEEPEEIEEIIERTSTFSSLNDALSIQWSILPNRLSPLFYILSVLYQYQQSSRKIPVESNIDDIYNVLETNNERYKAQSNRHADLLKQCVAQLDCEIAPVCAILGGVVGQEIVKIISRDNEVINNYLFFDGTKCSGVVEQIHPKH